MKVVRYIYTVLIIALVATAGYSLWYYQKQSDMYEKEKAELNQIFVDHDKKVKEMEQQKEKESSPPVGDEKLKIYKNTEYGFQFEYPSIIKVGEASNNSVLGDAENMVPGFFVSHYVFIPLGTEESRKNATNYFNGYKSIPKLNIQDKVDLYVSCETFPVENTQFSIEYVECEGEGGPAYYGLVKGNKFDIFIDGYSKGFGGYEFSENTKYLTAQELAKILGSIKVIN